RGGRGPGRIWDTGGRLRAARLERDLPGPPVEVADADLDRALGDRRGAGAGRDLGERAGEIEIAREDVGRAVLALERRAEIGDGHPRAHVGRAPGGAGRAGQRAARDRDVPGAAAVAVEDHLER